ncbi:MAG: hypothetical protein AVDCRST_MAG96-882 [uncultured Segetibacter sp.]|uniref:Uncharacterized protein n=1 Tax=uncultured Segetibacter sp. TaxID=481133 RepID=A0A6J4RYI3_9BACT|nr:MAG: hypothetical protein AVDCRST_MAG96-882 [uncultured Segetibacter sp.]
MFFAFAGILFKHPIFPTALKERGRSGSFLSRSEQRVPVVCFVGHLIGILTGDFIMLFLIVVLVGPVMYKNTKFFFLPNTIQIMISIYFGPAHHGAFCDMAQWRALS